MASSDGYFKLNCILVLLCVTWLPVTESKVPGPNLITVDKIAGVRLYSHITAQRRELN